MKHLLIRSEVDVSGGVWCDHFLFYIVSRWGNPHFEIYKDIKNIVWTLFIGVVSCNVCNILVYYLTVCL